jgi:uncharacterized protein YajQ (UPF0234 family)
MPSFDVVSEIDHHELANALDQANREVATRFDFKGSGSKFDLTEHAITLHTQADFQLVQMLDMLRNKMAKRGVDLQCLDEQEPEIQAKTATQVVLIREGLETEDAKKMVKLIKSAKTKVQTAIQGPQLRVTGKKRDDLQAVIALLKDAGFGIPLQFKNYRD